MGTRVSWLGNLSIVVFSLASLFGCHCRERTGCESIRVDLSTVHPPASRFFIGASGYETHVMRVRSDGLMSITSETQDGLRYLMTGKVPQCGNGKVPLATHIFPSRSAYIADIQVDSDRVRFEDVPYPSEDSGTRYELTRTDDSFLSHRQPLEKKSGEKRQQVVGEYSHRIDSDHYLHLLSYRHAEFEMNSVSSTCVLPGRSVIEFRRISYGLVFEIPGKLFAMAEDSKDQIQVFNEGETIVWPLRITGSSKAADPQCVTFHRVSGRTR